MKAVLRAVLTDPEARGAAKWDPAYGHQAEPVLAITRLARAMNAQSDGVFFRNTTGNSGQTVFLSPSVFNYYPPDHTLSSSGINAPSLRSTTPPPHSIASTWPTAPCSAPSILTQLFLAPPGRNSISVPLRLSPPTAMPCLIASTTCCSRDG